MRVGELVELAGAPAEGVGGAEQQTEDDQHDRDEPEVAEGVADDALEREAQHTDRERPHDDEPPQTRIGVVAGHLARQ